MFERFRKKKEIHHVYDILPAFDYENASEDETRKHFKSLSRVQLLEVNDRIDFDKIENKLDFYKIYYEVVDWNSWPVDDETNKAINTLRWNKDSTYNKVEKLMSQVAGIQKKLDKVETLISTAEFTLSGKDALKL